MFSKQEIKDFFSRYIEKKFFPDFSNKITWTVILFAIGIFSIKSQGGILIAIQLMKAIKPDNYQLDLDLISSSLTPSKYDYALCGFLLTVALTHNFSYKRLLLENEAASNKENQRKLMAHDQVLLKEFICLIPSNSPLIDFLQNHDFGNNFKLEVLASLEDFIDEWNCPEKSFFDQSIESKKLDFLEKSKEFSHLVGNKSSPTRSGRQSVVPDEYKNDFNWPTWIDDNIRLLNEKATKVFDSHQSFLKEAKAILRC